MTEDKNYFITPLNEQLEPITKKFGVRADLFTNRFPEKGDLVEIEGDLYEVTRFIYEETDRDYHVATPILKLIIKKNNDSEEETDDGLGR